MTKYLDPLISADPEICHGKPVFTGTRIMVWQILELLEANTSKKEIYKSYPTLPEGAIEAALRYAAQKVKGTSIIPFTSDHAPYVPS